MIDMLFITDRKNMNFIVNYNMLPSPQSINEQEILKGLNDSMGLPIENIQAEINLRKQKLCAETNRPLKDVKNIFPPYNTALNTFSGSASQDKADDMSKYVLN